MRLIRCAVGVLAVITLTGASRTQKAVPPAPPPPMVAPGEQSRVIGFNRIELHLLPATIYAKIRCERGDVTSLHEERELYARDGTTVNAADFEPAFTRTVQAAGYRAAEAGNTLFKSEERGT